MQAAAFWSYTECMLLMSKSLYNQQVMSLRLGSPIAVAVEPIINPHNLKILGWWCKKPGATKQQVLLAEDVREILDKGLAINDDDALSHSDDLVRHNDILSIHFQLINKAVKTKHQKLGKVSDYAYDTEAMMVQKLYVARPLTKIFASEDTLIIDRNQIIEVSDHYILVREADVEVTDEELAPAIEAAPAA
jgi:sporulation protein YlmC with PRC-barrel domain